MTPATRHLLAAMWENRPSLPELLFLTVAVLATHVVTGVSVTWLASAVLLIVIGGTLQQARTVLSRTAPSDPPAEGVEHAED
jgi:hypothetical protein